MAFLALIVVLVALQARCGCASSVAWSNTTATTWNSPSLSTSERTTSTKDAATTAAHAPGYYVAYGLGLATSLTSGVESSSYISASPKILSVVTSQSISSSNSTESDSTKHALSNDGSSSSDRSTSRLLPSSNSTNIYPAITVAAIGPTDRSSSESSSPTASSHSIVSGQASGSRNGTIAIGTVPASHTPSHSQYNPSASANSSVLSQCTHNNSAAVTTASGYSSSGFPYPSANATSRYGATAAPGTGTLPRPTGGNYTNSTGADDCWTAWTNYWYTASSEDGWVTPGETAVSTDYDIANVTYTMTLTDTSTVFSTSSGTFTYTSTSTVMPMNGPWVQTTMTGTQSE